MYPDFPLFGTVPSRMANKRKKSTTLKLKGYSKKIFIIMVSQRITFKIIRPLKPKECTVQLKNNLISSFENRKFTSRTASVTGELQSQVPVM